jgi:aspartate/methionine/tyrosine aminotransferase
MKLHFNKPMALRAAELDNYKGVYGYSVHEMDTSLSRTSSPSDLIDLTHGDTRAFLPPTNALSDFNDAVNENSEAYSPYRGSLAVRKTLAPRISTLLNREVDPQSELIITPGTEGGLFTALSAVTGPNDVVAYPSKEYFMNERITTYLGAKSHRLPLYQSSDGWLSIAEEDLEAATRVGATILLLSNPNNPTGGVYSHASAQLIAKWVVANNMIAIVDQLYCRLVFDGREYVHLGSLPGMAERTITLVGPSKTESMSGYRVGIAVAPRPILDAMEVVISMTSLRTAGYSQHVLRHWMDSDGQWLAERTTSHQAIRDYLVRSLRNFEGMKVSSSAGSSYVFPNFSETKWATTKGSHDDHLFARELKEIGVLINPGYQFGLDGCGHFRINFSQNREALEKAIERIGQLLS